MRGMVAALALLGFSAGTSGAGAGVIAQGNDGRLAWTGSVLPEGGPYEYHAELLFNDQADRVRLSLENTSPAGYYVGMLDLFPMTDNGNLLFTNEQVSLTLVGDFSGGLDQGNFSSVVDSARIDWAPPAFNAEAAPTTWLTAETMLSSETVPEPSALAMLAVGLLAIRRRR